MTNQMNAVMMQQAQIIGSFLDAKDQLEAQTELQTRTAQAHKDYHPSEQMCEFGTFARNLADTQRRAVLTKIAASDKVMERELVSGDAATAEGEDSDTYGRLATFRKNYCNVNDNGSGLAYLCKNKSGPPARRNRDVDYTLTLENPLTLDIDLLDGTAPTPDEENVMALLNYLLLHKPMPNIGGDSPEFMKGYQDMRSIIAMRGVARNSLSSIIAQKTAGPKHEGSATPYIKSLLKQMGLSDTAAATGGKSEIDQIIGENPSYFAQMEVLTKKIYQDPAFYTNLYDKPANVKRIRATMEAIKLMQDRDIHEALMRREMLVSMILEIQLRRQQEDIAKGIGGAMEMIDTGVGFDP